MTTQISTLAAILVLLTASAVLATVPQLMTYQGSLSNTDGTPVADGGHQVKFIIWDAPTAGTEIWNSGFQTVNTVGGLFTVQLGSAPMPAFPSYFATDTSRYLGVTVGALPEMSPRLKLTSVLYSYQALLADSAGSVDWTGISNMPAGFADGVDNEGGSTGGGWVDNGTRVVLVDSSDWVGIGRSLPINSNEIFGLGKNTASWGGMFINTSGANGRPFYGYATEGQFRAYSYYDGLSRRWALFSNGSNRLEIDSLGNVGIGASPLHKLHVASDDEVTAYFSTNNSSSTTLNYAVRGEANGTNTASGTNHGVQGKARGAHFNVGGTFSSVTQTAGGGGTGVVGFASGESTGGDRVGVYGYAWGGDVDWAGYFAGDVGVTGTLTEGASSSRIDHPLDPENKYLYHSFVESPDMMRVYNGNVTTDTEGYATVKMPDYFDALNREFRYQLTVIGDFAQAIIAEEVSQNQFTIRTDKPNVKVSWMVTGIRKDAYAEANRIIVEIEKEGKDKGLYIHPEAFGKSKELGIDYKRNRRLGIDNE